MEKPKFAVGETIIYINSNGVNFGERKIVQITHCFGEHKPRYFIEPTDAPWFPVSEKTLRKVKT